jgi:hypothetical protein
MENLLYFYITFSYLFVLGAKTEGNTNLFSVLISPLSFPFMLGLLCARIFKNQ